MTAIAVDRVLTVEGIPIMLASYCIAMHGHFQHLTLWPCIAIGM